MMNDMTSFKNILIRNIKAKRFDRDYYEKLIAMWSVNGYLTEEELVEVMQVLDEVYPLEEEQK